MNRTFSSGVKFALAVIAVLSCSDNSLTGADSFTSDDLSADAARIASVTVSLASSSIALRDTTRATATLRDNNNSIISRPLTWSSSNPGIATIDTSGLVTGLAQGTAVLTASRSGKSGSATITVMPALSATATVPVASVRVSLAASSLNPGQFTQATATTYDSANNVLSGRAITWSSGNTAVATVDTSGVVTAVAVGTADIIATSEGKSGSAPLAVSTPTSTKPGTVTDLKVSAIDSTGVTLLFTQVDDGTGQPAHYDIRYAVSPISWGDAASTTSGTCPTPVAGTAIGSPLACKVLGLKSVTKYDFQLVAFRGTLNFNAVFGGLSNVATATTNASGPTPVATVSVSPATASIQVGATVQLTATTRDSAGNTLTGRTITWSSNNTGVETVSNSGLVTGIAAGSAQITATSEGKSGSAAITVTSTTTKPGAVTDLRVSATDSTRVTLLFTQVDDGTGHPALYDIRYSIAPISWGDASSTTSGTCTTPVNGTAIGSPLSCTVLGLRPSTNYNFQLVPFRGTLNFNAVFGPLSDIAAATTTASNSVSVASVTVSLANSTLSPGQTTQATATTRDANNNILTGRSITWSSSNTAVASVSSSGLVSSIAGGNAQIIATSEGQSGSATLTVNSPPPPPPVPVASVSVSLSSTVLNPGQTTQATATTRDANNNVLTGRAVSWTSSNTAVATVSGSGLVTAVAAGSAQITATSEGVAGSAGLTVNAPTSGGSNEPPGMTRISERPFSALQEDPSWDTDNTLSIISDASGPKSPPGAIRATYPTGYSSGGSAPGHAGIAFGPQYRTLYISYWGKLSANFYGHSSGVNKQCYAWTGGNPSFYFNARGVGTDPLVPEITFQSTTMDPGQGLYLPNLVPSAVIPRGVWYHVEVLLVGNSAGNADGSFDWWLDGVHVGSHKNYQYTSGATAWNIFEFRPVWGGVGGPSVPATMTLDWDHVYLSGS